VEDVSWHPICAGVASGQQPTYAYLATQPLVQDETWQVDGVNSPSLPSPDSNSGNLPPGEAYSKYEWSLYHHENPMFRTLRAWHRRLVHPARRCHRRHPVRLLRCGPQHQDLAIHQDALILNYFSRNHYGEPAYPLAAGYRRLYGLWLTFFTVGTRARPTR
jgi:rhamnogalacturonan endolyase